ncbi:MAG: putative lipid II flippase FtsW [Clostridiales Family XIII bacterium]|jgi:cell division protein FtsW|nr:putative lipid II flippase FtsW [Clostridiales Family XIII bacterium]
MKIKFRIGRIDVPLLIIVIALVLFGLVMVFSASYYSTITQNLSPYYYLQRAAIWAAVGIIVMVIVSFLPTALYKRAAVWIMAFSLLMLLALFTPLGVTVNGATRWIGVGGEGGLTFMPGEFTKLAVIIFLAWYYTKYSKGVKTLRVGVAPVLVLMLVLFFLIYKEPNLSTAGIVVITIFVIMFLAGVRIGYLIALIAIGAIGLYFLIQTGEGEHLARVTGFLDPFSDAQGDFYQTVQGLLALGSGGLTGVGLGNSVEKALWLPEAQNDFIFAIVGEETGFIGCILLMLGFLVLIWRCMLISMRARTRFDMLIGAGVTALMAVQVVLNIGVVTSLLPPTGVILPFISYGGNAVVLFMFLMGIMLSISRKDPALAPEERLRPWEEAS